MLISLSRFVYTLHLNIVIRIHVLFLIRSENLIWYRKQSSYNNCYKDLSSLEIRVEFCIFVVKIWKIMWSTMVCHWSNYWQLLDYEILEYSLSSVNYVICQFYVWPEILLNINIYLRALSIYIEIYIYVWLSKETITVSDFNWNNNLTWNLRNRYTRHIRDRESMYKM